MIISFYSDPEALPASASQTIVQTAPEIEQPVAEPVKIVEQEQPPEINIEVPLEQLTNEAFKGRTVVIDAGHGGGDTGFVYPGRTPEKNITLSVAGFLQQSLQKVGLKAVNIRSSDTEMTQSERTSIANRHGADLIISLHVGASNSPDKTGVCCLVYSKAGTVVADEKEILTEAAVYREWLENTRFDLASFLARRINERLKTQLKVESRGVKQLPVSQLKYLINPAVLVEIGMLSDPTEGKNLLSSKYHEAVAAAITNGVIDFFNGIVIKP
jgi:N-acetylmuramoyl-L-alanine amidase